MLEGRTPPPKTGNGSKTENGGRDREPSTLEDVGKWTRVSYKSEIEILVLFFFVFLVSDLE